VNLRDKKKTPDKMFGRILKLNYTKKNSREKKNPRIRNADTNAKNLLLRFDQFFIL